MLMLLNELFFFLILISYLNLKITSEKIVFFLQLLILIH